jgi:hypothetical protein
MRAGKRLVKIAQAILQKAYLKMASVVLRDLGEVLLTRGAVNSVLVARKRAMVKM